MHLYVEANDGFLGNDDAARPPPAPGAVKPAPLEKSHVFIQTNGPFAYDPNKDFAVFDIPKVPPSGAPPGTPQQQVLVSRRNPGEKFDQLVCHRLDLQFRKKTVV